MTDPPKTAGRTHAKPGAAQPVAAGPARAASEEAGPFVPKPTGLRVTAVTCVKNEGPFLLEWIAYHRLIGVTDFLFYSNDCDDGTDRLLDVLAARGGVDHRANPAEGRNYQMEALRDARGRAVVQSADWIWVADVDEFLNIHAGDHGIAALIEACGDPAAISVGFQFFANAGVERFADRPVIAQFTRSHNPDIWCDQTAIEVKTLVRKDFPLHYLGAHRPFLRRGLPPSDRPRWTDGSGRPVPEAFVDAANKRRIRKFPALGTRRFATLNHYALRSLDSYLVKTDRGDVNRDGRVFDSAYWRERNDPAQEDRSILRMLPALRHALEVLKADPAIAAAHDACVAAHRAKAARLRAMPEFSTLAETLAGLPPVPAKEADLARRLGVAWP